MRKPTATLKSGMSLIEVCKAFKPTILMGLSAFGGLFKEELIREMAKNNERPFVFPLSNPTRNAECTAENAYKWSDGRAIFASGSPFAPVTLPDGRIMHISQCNNMFIFPGIGLAVSAGKCTKVTDEMLYAASVAVANALTDDDRAQGRVYPKVVPALSSIHRPPSSCCSSPGCIYLVYTHRSAL